MTTPRKIVLYGGGDMALEVIAFLADARRAGDATLGDVSDIVDQSGKASPDVVAALPDDTPVHRSIDSVSDLASKQVIICIGDAVIRDRILDEIRDLPEAPGLATLIHPRAYVADGARVGSGAIIAPFAYVGPGAELGDNVLVNVSATIGHHVEVGRSSVVSPHADLNGRAILGEAVFIGAGAVLAPRSAIGMHSKVATGSVVSGKHGDGFLLAGNPAKGRQMFKIPEKNGEK